MERLCVPLSAVTQRYPPPVRLWSGRVASSESPAWWRDATPKKRVLSTDGVLSGPVSEFDAARLHPGTYQRLVPLAFERAEAGELTIPLDEVHLTVVWSEFNRCTFTQGSRRLMADGTAAQGFFGHPHGPSLYRDCTFSRVQFGGLGRFRLWVATFENCIFDRCTWGSKEYDADFLGCTFVGKMHGGAIGGASPETGRTTG